jgi:hypothetical protein
MSKGYKPRDKDRPPVQTIDVGDSGGDGGGSEVEVKSWQFSLVDKTEYASLAKVGTPVTGIVNGVDVAVRNGSYYYGFAPKDVALEIIEAIKGKGKLVGTIISVNVALTPSDMDVWVRLVLR